MRSTHRLGLTMILALVPLLTSAQPQALPVQEDVVRQAVGNDLYAAGGEFAVSQAIVDDLYIAGGEIIVSSVVGGDLVAAGGTVTIDAAVRDDIRVLGGEVTINGDVSGDVVMIGGKLHIARDVRIGGDVYVMGGTISQEGAINGSLFVRGDEVSLLGSVRGDADVRAQRLAFSTAIGGDARIAAKQWFVGDDAAVAGNLDYWQPGGERTFDNIVRGSATYLPDLAFKEMQATPASIVGLIVSFIIFNLLSSALIIGLLLLATKTFFRDAAKRLRTRPWKSLLIGFLFFILTPISALLLCITLIGLPLGFLALAAYAFSFVFAKPLTAVVLAKAFEAHQKQQYSLGLLFLLSVAAYLALHLLGLIPVLGWLAVATIVCMSFGALLETKYRRYLKIR